MLISNLAQNLTLLNALQHEIKGYLLGNCSKLCNCANFPPEGPQICFLVGAFSFREKARLLQWLVFFLFFSSDHRPHRECTTFYRLHVFTRSRVVDSTRFTVNPAVTGSSPCFSQKLFRAIFIFFFGTVRLPVFFGTVRLFFDFFAFKGSQLQFFSDILQQTKVPKSPKGLSFYVFRHYETVQNSYFFRNLQNFRILFVSKGFPFNLFDILHQSGFSKARRVPLLTSLKTLRFLSLRYSADFRRSRFVLIGAYCATKKPNSYSDLCFFSRLQTSQ